MHAGIITCSLGKYYARSNTTTAEKQREPSGTGQTKTVTANKKHFKNLKALKTKGIILISPVKTLSDFNHQNKFPC